MQDQIQDYMHSGYLEFQKSTGKGGKSAEKIRDGPGTWY